MRTRSPSGCMTKPRVVRIGVIMRTSSQGDGDEWQETGSLDQSRQLIWGPWRLMSTWLRVLVPVQQFVGHALS